MARSSLLLLLGLVGLAAGCVESRIIGYRCLDGQRECVVVRLDAGPDAESDGAMVVTPRDAGTDSPEPDDAGPPSDAGDAAFVTFLRNRSFELVPGSQPGALDDSTTRVDNWQRCPNLFDFLQGLSIVEQAVVLEGVLPIGTLEPTQGDTFAQFAFVAAGFPFLTQQLSETWPAGERHAFTIDLAGQGLLDALQLTILGGSTGCPTDDMRELLASIPITGTTRGAWNRNVCVELTPDADVDWLLLHPVSSVIELDAGVASRVFIDNVRETRSCP